MSVIARLGKFLGIFGPNSQSIAHGRFTTSGNTGAVTTNEANGFTVARTGVGVFVVTYAKAAKVAPTVTFSVQGSTTAQLFIITANTTTATTFTQVTAGGSTAVDTLAATIHVQAIQRYTS